MRSMLLLVLQFEKNWFPDNVTGKKQGSGNRDQGSGFMESERNHAD